MKAGGGVGLPFQANKHQIYEASGDTTGAGAVKNRKVLQIWTIRCLIVTTKSYNWENSDRRLVIGGAGKKGEVVRRSKT